MDTCVDTDVDTFVETSRRRGDERRRRAATTSHNDERRRAATTATATTTVGIPVRIEAGTDNDAATTRRDDDDATTTTTTMTRRRRGDDDAATTRRDDEATTQRHGPNVATEMLPPSRAEAGTRRHGHDEPRRQPAAPTCPHSRCCLQLPSTHTRCSSLQPPSLAAVCRPSQKLPLQPQLRCSAPSPHSRCSPPASLPHSRCSPPSRVSGRGAGNRGVRW